ncbi:hypothetical protein JCM8547_008935 [Rhodosporidiobolus lusitaniae]
MSASPSQRAFTSHLLARVQSDLQFLHSQSVLSQHDYNDITARLSAVQAQQEMGGLTLGGRQQQQQQQQGRGTVAPPPPLPVQPTAAVVMGSEGKARCKAVWDYNKAAPDDLPFRAGDIITIEEETNADWWKGSCNGQTGLFPSNHVERLPPSSAMTPPSSTPASSYNAGYAPPPPNTYAPPPSQAPQQHQPYAYAQPQGYGSTSTLSSEKSSQLYQAPPPPPPSQHNVYAPPLPSQPQQPIVVQSPEEAKKNKKFGGLGKTVGHAFAGGAGFGVGSALTSNAINAIF